MVLAFVMVTFLIYANINVRHEIKTKIAEYNVGLAARSNENQLHESNNIARSEAGLWKENHNVNEKRVTYASVTLPKETASSSNSDTPRTASKTDLLTKTPSPTRRNEVIFPDITNCSHKEYKSKLKVSKVRTNVRVCRWWKEPNPNDPLWPMVVPPTNGSILKTLPVHHRDPEVSTEGEYHEMLHYQLSGKEITKKTEI